MTRGRIAAASFAGALLVSGCGSGGTPRAAAGTVAGNAEAEIIAQEDQWNREYAARDLEGLIAHYAPGATLKEPDTPPLSGGWIRTSFEAAMNDPAFAMTFAHDRIEVAASGDIAYSRGHYQVSWTDPQSRQPTTHYGSYLTVWQRQADGHWKVLEDFESQRPRPRPLM
jgi:ketosteroid isomerase-like protein